MPNYCMGRIYRLEFPCGSYYIGSTTVELSIRKAGHKGQSKTGTSKLHQFIRTQNWSDVNIVLVEKCPCDDRETLLSKEAEHIRAARSDPKCLNSVNAYRNEFEILPMQRPQTSG